MERFLFFALFILYIPIRGFAQPALSSSRFDNDPPGKVVNATEKGGIWTEQAHTWIGPQWYVSSSAGNDSTGNGSQAFPFKTIRKALDVITDLNLMQQDSIFIDGAINDSGAYNIFKPHELYFTKWTASEARISFSDIKLQTNNVRLKFNDVIFDSLISFIQDSLIYGSRVDLDYCKFENGLMLDGSNLYGYLKNSDINFQLKLRGKWPEREIINNQITCDINIDLIENSGSLGYDFEANHIYGNIQASYSSQNGKVRHLSGPDDDYSLIFQKNRIIGNIEIVGVYLWSAIRNNIIEGNIFTDTNLISAEIVNNTILGKIKVSSYIAYIRNNIIYNENGGGVGIDIISCDSFWIGYNNLYDFDTLITCSDTAGLHLTSFDPLFADSLYHLFSASPARDAGDPSQWFNDVDGTRNDLGNYGGPGGESYNYPIPQFIKIVSGDIANDSYPSAGSSWGDYNNDGYQDIFVSTGDYGDNLYRNNTDGTFTKITNSGISVTDYGTCSSWGDYDNDGSLDIFVAEKTSTKRYSPLQLYKNDGNGIFTPITTGPIANDNGDAYGCSWVDYDNDGALDLFVANEFGVNNFLYRNDGQGNFVKITLGIIVNDGGNSNSAVWADYDNDGDLDLFVANDLQNNFLYRNEGDGNFAKITTGSIVNDGGKSFGASWGDYDNDGDLDLFVANGGYPDYSPQQTNNVDFLYRNNGDGTFSKIIDSPVVQNDSISTGSCWGDYDNDGDLDLFVATENYYNYLYTNDGNGNFSKTISSISNEISDSYGASWGDFNNDGAIDLFVANGYFFLDRRNFLYQNTGNSNNWINVHCVGTVSNTSAIGAKIRIKSTINGNPVWQLREISGQTGFGSQNSLNAEFGLGDATIIDSIKIEWPSGIDQFLTNVSTNQFLTITEPYTPQEFVVGEVSCPEDLSQGCSLKVAINIDMNNVLPPDTLLGSFAATLEWDPTELDFVNHSGILQGFVGVVDTTNVDSGIIIFNGANPNGASGIVGVLNIDYNVIGSVGAIALLDLEFSSIVAANTFEDLTPILIVNDDSLTITEEFLGDVNCDGQANSTDALIILSNDTGLPILDPCTIDRLSEGFGDITNDGLTNSLDALIIISYDVGIPVVPFPVGEIYCP